MKLFKGSTLITLLAEAQKNAVKYKSTFSRFMRKHDDEINPDLSKFQILGDELTEKSKPNDIASQVGDTK